MLDSESALKSDPELPRASDGSTAREVAHRCARAAAEILRAATRQSRTGLAKGTTAGGRVDLVTVTDPAIERAVIEIVQAAYPDHALLGEETGGHAGAAQWLWIVDPIDGTRNFSAGIPLVAFNLALAHAGTTRLALTLDALHDEIYYAESGAGATLNGDPLHIDATTDISRVFLGVDLGLDDDRARLMLGALHDLFPQVQAIRVPGTVALGLAYVAAGTLDAYLHPAAYAWDFAPGALLVQEAGGYATEIDGSPLTLTSRSVLASAPGAHAALVAAFRRVAEGGRHP
jgi:myo-inositol-1(or 4)-monophosphatase